MAVTLLLCLYSPRRGLADGKYLNR
jgi:hypothetical protein